MTFLEAQRAARRGGHRLKDAGRTPNGLFRMLVCERCGGKILFWFRDGALNQGLLTEQLCDVPEKGLYCPGGWVGQYLWGSADE